MKFGKGTIKNINKKLIAGTLAMTLVMVPMFGCTNEQYTKFEYCVNEHGGYTYSGVLLYSTIKDYKVVVLEKNDNYSIYIVSAVDGSDISKNNYRKEFYNIFGGNCIYDIQKDTDLNVVSEELLSDYLVVYDKVQNSYSAEEIEEILEQIKIDYSRKNNKQLVKEK